MVLQQIQAMPHPAGNRIDLCWRAPDPVEVPNVRVVRRVGAHPTLNMAGANPVSARDGVVIADVVIADAIAASDPGMSETIITVTDQGLESETVYYYTLYPYSGDPPSFEFDARNRAAAMATGVYNLAERLYDLLPGIYYRYDTKLPPAASDSVAPADRTKGQLRRFLDLPGSHLDQFYSGMRAALDLHNVGRVDGALLPLLAGWIGWETDFRRELDAQRNEIRNAPQIYQTIGIVPTVEATVKRMLGWESRTKEFVHNVFRSNTPERLTIWARTRDPQEVWSEPTAPLSLDDAYDGRIAVAQTADGATGFFYHTLRNGRWDIVYKLWTAAAGWLPSEPLTNRRALDRHPTAARQGSTTRVFWNTYEPDTRRWRIEYRTQTGDAVGGVAWSDSATLAFPADAPAAEQPARKRPWAVADNADPNGLWLFWLELPDALPGSRWQVRYNRHDGSAWQLTVPITFPPDTGDSDPRVQDDVFATFRATDQSLWLFWSRRMPVGELEQTRWQIAYRVKSSLSVDASGWSEVRVLPDASLDEDAREPYALVRDDGNLEIFWSANRNGSWSIWHGRLDAGTHTWITPPSPVTANPYTQRSPSAVLLNDELHLLYRANNSLTYTSAVYGATETLDARYAGSTTVDTRNVAKTALRSQYEDFQTYTYDAGQNGRRTHNNRYARDTVGMYLTPDTEDPVLIERNQNLIERVLRQFLPISVRIVFIIEPSVRQESVYSDTRRIEESYSDNLSGAAADTYAGPADAHGDAAPDWTWLASWDASGPSGGTVDTDADPVDLRIRTRHTDMENEG